MSNSINLAPDEELEFYSDEATISYGIRSAEECMIEFSEEDGNICFIDLIQVYDLDDKGKGYGTLLLKDFLDRMSEAGIKKFYLFAAFTESEYEDENYSTDEEKLNALHRIIKFYQRFGFEDYGMPSSYNQQVDMFLHIKD